MVFDGICQLITAMVNALFSALPAWDMTGFLSSAVPGDTSVYQGFNGATNGSMGALQMVWLMMWQCNQFVPVDSLMAILSIGATVWAAKSAFKGAMMVIAFLRGCGFSFGGGA